MLNHYPKAPRIWGAFSVEIVFLTYIYLKLVDTYLKGLLLMTVIRTILTVGDFYAKKRGKRVHLEQT